MIMLHLDVLKCMQLYICWNLPVSSSCVFFLTIFSINKRVEHAGTELVTQRDSSFSIPPIISVVIYFSWTYFLFGPLMVFDHLYPFRFYYGCVPYCCFEVVTLPCLVGVSVCPIIVFIICCTIFCIYFKSWWFAIWIVKIFNIKMYVRNLYLYKDLLVTMFFSSFFEVYFKAWVSFWLNFPVFMMEAWGVFSYNLIFSGWVSIWWYFVT